MSRTSTGSSSRSSEARERIGRALRELGVRPSRRLGQSFLIDEHVADAEAALVAEGPGPYLEIGPGLGTLTQALIRRGLSPLVLLERDARLAAHLRRTLVPPVEIRTGDALEADLGEFGTICGNLPFATATPILLRAVRSPADRTVALVQEEVAQRLTAGPGSGDYGRLTLAIGLHAEAERFLPVPSGSFEPVPAVSGRVVVLRRRVGPLPVPDESGFEEMTRQLFSSRRKQLKNLLPPLLTPGTDPDRVAELASWPPDWATRRPEGLAPEAYHRLAAVLYRPETAPSSDGLGGPESARGARRTRSAAR